MQFIKKLRVCDMDGMSPEDLINYDSLVKQATREYHNDSKRWEPATDKENYQEQPSLPKAYTFAIKYLVNKSLKKVYFNRRHSGGGGGSGGGSSARSNLT